MQPKKLNLGSGLDYRPNFVNLDANPAANPDVILNLETQRLTDSFPPNSFTLIVANDILEHLLRPHTITTLADAFTILTPKGCLIARLPHASLIIDSHIPVADKLTLLYGGQNLPVDPDHRKNPLRAAHPEFFAHKFGWIPETFHAELQRVGFKKISSTTNWPNFTTVAHKP